MVKKILPAAFIIVSLVTGQCLADAAAELKQANTYMRAGLSGRAEAIYNSIVQNSPGTDSALQGQTKLVALYIVADRSSDEQAGLAKLKTDFAGNPELASSLYAIGLRYKAVWRTEDANSINSEILRDYPGSYPAEKAVIDNSKDKILRFIDSGKYAQAQSDTEQMISDFGSGSALGAALYNIAREYKERWKYDEAKAVYQRMTGLSLSQAYQKKAEQGIRKMELWSMVRDYDPNAAGAIESLVTDYASDSALSGMLHGIGIQYGRARQYDKAKAVYERIVRDYPGSRAADKAGIDIEKCKVLGKLAAGDDAGVSADVNDMIASFSGHWYLPQAIARIAEQYCSEAFAAGGQDSSEGREDFSNAAGIWDKVIHQVSDSVYRPDAYCRAGDCYLRLGQAQKAAEYFETVVDEYPGYKRRWHGLFMVGRCYENLKQAGQIDSALANTKIRAAYQEIVNRYPGCKMTAVAQSWLDNNGQ